LLSEQGWREKNIINDLGSVGEGAIAGGLELGTRKCSVWLLPSFAAESFKAPFFDRADGFEVPLSGQR
jgi:hypothetical protein